MIKRSVPTELRNPAKECSKGKDRASIELNYYIGIVRAKILQIHRELEMDGKEVSATVVRDRFYGRDKVQRSLPEVYAEHNEKCRGFNWERVFLATVEKFETSIRHLKMFIRSRYHREDVFLDEVNMEFLTKEELEVLMNKEFAIKRPEQVHDVFAFCCFSGIAFSEVYQLSREHLVKDNNGALWIRKARQQTKQMCNIPVLSPAKRLIEKYAHCPECVAKNVL